jgi:hypothetical protein
MNNFNLADLVGLAYPVLIDHSNLLWPLARLAIEVLVTWLRTRRNSTRR